MFKIFKFVIFAVISTALFIGYGCQQEAVIDQDYSDAPYLSLPSGTDFNNLTTSELKIIMMAFDRMNLTEDEDGISVLNTRYGWEVNVSENVYLYCKEIVNNTNEWLLSGKIQSRADRVNPIERPGERETDCLTYVISLALNKPYKEVDKVLTNHYGYGGVPLEYTQVALSYFGRVATMDVNQIPNNTAINGYKYIAILRSPNPENPQSYHAVNIQGVFNGRLYFVDPQSGHMNLLETPVLDVYHLYHYY